MTAVSTIRSILLASIAMAVASGALAADSRAPAKRVSRATAVHLDPGGLDAHRILSGLDAALNDPDVRLHALKDLAWLAEHDRQGLLGRLDKDNDHSIATSLAAVLNCPLTLDESATALEAYAKLYVHDNTNRGALERFLCLSDQKVTGHAVEALMMMAPDLDVASGKPLTSIERYSSQLALLLRCPPDAGQSCSLAVEVAIALAATDALRSFGPEVRALLARPDTRAQAVRAIERARLVPQYLGDINAILDERLPRPRGQYDDQVAALSAITAAELARNERYEGAINAALKQRDDFDLMKQAVLTIESAGLDGRYRSDLESMLRDPQEAVRLAAIYGLAKSAASRESRLRDYADADEIGPALDAKGSNDPRSAVWRRQALGAIAASDLESFHGLISWHLAHGDADELKGVVDGLASAGSTPRYLAGIQERLKDEKSFAAQQALLPAFLSQGCSLEDQVRLAAPYDPLPGVLAPYKAAIYLCSGGSRDAQLLLALVPRQGHLCIPSEPPNQAMLSDDHLRRHAFELLVSLAGVDSPPSKPPSKTWCDIELGLIDLAQLINWQPDDLKRLCTAKHALEEGHHKRTADELAGIINRLSWRARAGRWLGPAVRWIFVPAAVLIIINMLYSRYEWAQRVFWYEQLRQELKLYYGDLLLAAVPFLCRRLLAPRNIRHNLLGDGAMQFNDAAYFGGSQFKARHSDQLSSLADLPLDGKLVITGGAGVGKTAFLYHLVRSPGELAVLLPASRCSNGLMPAVQAALPSGAADFLKRLVETGKLRVCIDDLGGADEMTRRKIADFIDEPWRANIVLTAKKEDFETWRVPSGARVYVLQPLQDENAIRAFLLSRMSILPEEAPVKGDLYRQRCIEFLQERFQSGLSEQVLADRIRDLSTPLTLVDRAMRIGRGESIESLTAMLGADNENGD